VRGKETVSTSNPYYLCKYSKGNNHLNEPVERSLKLIFRIIKTIHFLFVRRKYWN